MKKYIIESYIEEQFDVNRIKRIFGICAKKSLDKKKRKKLPIKVIGLDDVQKDINHMSKDQISHLKTKFSKI